MKIEVESEALDSLKAMVQRLQTERDELLEALQKAQYDINWMLNNEQLLNGFVFDYIENTIAKCTKEPEVMATNER